MSKYNPKTKDKILEAAELIFHENGYKGARTTQIAEKAGISRTMLHYYYRTKEDLFQEVLLNSFGHFVKHVQQFILEKNDLKASIDKFVDLLYDMLQEKPSLPSFVVNLLNESPELLTDLPFVQEEQIPSLFDPVLEEARKQQVIDSDITGEHLMINIYGLCAIPYLSAPLIQFKEQRSKEEMQQFMQDRKAMIKSFVWNGLKGQH